MRVVKVDDDRSTPFSSADSNNSTSRRSRGLGCLAIRLEPADDGVRGQAGGRSRLGAEVGSD